MEKDWVDILNALLVPVVAVLGVSIALLQWNTNRNRLKHELFDRRYAQFSVVRDFIGSIIRNGELVREAEQAYLLGIKGVSFTFDDELANYLEEYIWSPAIELQTLDSMVAALPIGDERTNNVHRQAEIKKALYIELTKLELKFSKYLQLSH